MENAICFYEISQKLNDFDYNKYIAYPNKFSYLRVTPTSVLKYKKNIRSIKNEDSRKVDSIDSSLAQDVLSLALNFISKSNDFIILQAYCQKNKIIILDILFDASDRNILDLPYSERIALLNAAYNQSQTTALSIINKTTFINTKSNFYRSIDEQGMTLIRYYINDPVRYIAIGVISYEKTNKSSETLLLLSTDGIIVEGLGKIPKNSPLPLPSNNPISATILPDTITTFSNKKTISYFYEPIVITINKNTLHGHSVFKIPVGPILEVSKYNDCMQFDTFVTNNIKLDDKIIKSLQNIPTAILINELTARNVINGEQFENCIKQISQQTQMIYNQKVKEIKTNLTLNIKKDSSAKGSPVLHEINKEPNRFKIDDSKKKNISKFKRLSTVLLKKDYTKNDLKLLHTVLQVCNESTSTDPDTLKLIKNTKNFVEHKIKTLKQ